MTVLVVGLGGIGQEVAKRLSGLGATIIGTSRTSRPIEHVDRLIQVADIVSTVPEVDAIVLTLPGTAATEKLIGADVFAAVKPGTILVNVGRGTVVDEDALLPALRDGRIGFAALDVFATEPLPHDSPLWASRMSWSAPTRRPSTRPRTGSSPSCSLPTRPAFSMETNSYEQGGYR